MRRSLLSAIAIFFVIASITYLTRSSTLSLFFQGVTQSIFHAPKVSLYVFAMGKEEDTELSRLRDENRLLLEKIAEYDKLKKDNQALQDQFQETSISTSTLVPANIVGFQGSLLTPEVIVIDKGANDNISVGKAVIVGKNLVGIVDRISAKYSSVHLVNSSDFQTIVKTQSSGATGIAKGAGEFILIDRITVNESIKKEELVLTRGTMDTTRTGIPPGLILGKVISVKKVESEPFQVAQVKTLVDMTHITKVFVQL